MHLRAGEHCSEDKDTQRLWTVVYEAGKLRAYSQEGGVGKVGQTSLWSLPWQQQNS